MRQRTTTRSLRSFRKEFATGHIVDHKQIRAMIPDARLLIQTDRQTMRSSRGKLDTAICAER